jgi:hypothetical protein
VSAWSRAQPEDERKERELFAQRALALPPASVPSLETVLREVDRTREAHESHRARGRALVGMALAAACVAASVAGVPRIGARLAAHDRIVADRDASSPSAVLSIEPAREACEADPSEEVVAMSSQPPACYAPTASFPGEPTKYEPAIAPVCSANQSCLIAGP